MQNKGFIIILLLLICINVQNLIATPFDTGMKTFTQPNQVTFTGRMWGDEFISWGETDNGYRFVQAIDGYYYYAQLDTTGEFEASIYKVAIDTPPPYSYQLQRSRRRLDEIIAAVATFQQNIQDAAIWFEQKKTVAENLNLPYVELKLAVIFIEFPDIPHYISIPSRQYGYTASDFENLLFSTDSTWSGTSVQTAHPENEKIFGSFAEYWDAMSQGKLLITGNIVNPIDTNDIPVWLTADHIRSWYFTEPDWKALGLEAIDKALDNGWISENPNAQNYYDKKIVIFAQESFNSDGTKNLNIHAGNGTFIQMSERSSRQLQHGNNPSFTHMGVYAHEFGHNLGFHDEYHLGSPGYSIESQIQQEDGKTCAINFDLMGWGLFNGPERKGACPATLSPFYRIDKNWLTYTDMNNDAYNYQLNYSYPNHNIYKIAPLSAPGDEHYLIESRGKTGFDKYLPDDPNLGSSQPGRLIIWHQEIDVTLESGYHYHDRIKYIPADESREHSSQLTDLFPSTFSPDYQDLNDISEPMAALGYSINLPPEIGNHRPAHFALFGIRSGANHSTIIDSIKLNWAMVEHDLDGGFQMVSVPVGAPDYSLNSLFPNALLAYEFVPGSGFVQRTTLENGPGYWVQFPAQQHTIDLAGTTEETLTVRLSSSWNVIGTISDSVFVRDVEEDPLESINGIYSYTYSSGYELLGENDYIVPGIGYWIDMNNVAEVTLIRSHEPEELGIEKISTDPVSNLNDFDRFIITDADGFSQTIYVCNTEVYPSMEEKDLMMPPAMPELEFDSRFAQGEFVKKVSSASGQINLEILVETTNYPVTLEWIINPDNGLNYLMPADSILGKGSMALNKSGSVSFSRLNGRINMLASTNDIEGVELTPSEFKLRQNYPNPFNPSTSIKYQLPEKTHVKVEVFNMLGQSIKILVDEEKPAGYYETEFTPVNLASGVYICNIKAGKFDQSVKMVYMK